jgi:small-conductance mechanosensitive channel
MIPYLNESRAWLIQLSWTVGALVAAWAIGHVLNATFVPLISKWARQTRGTWDDAVIDEIKPRLPRWTLLLGVWISLLFWPLNAQARALIDSTVFVVAVASVTFAVAAITSRMVADYGARVSPGVPVTSLSRNLAWAAVVAFGVLAILNHLGVSITPMITAFGIGGLAVALALQDPLANFFAGLIVTLARQVRIGDYIKLDTGVEGEIVDFNWRLTRIRTVTGKLVLVPNLRLAQAVITNYSQPSPDVPVGVELGVDASSDLAHVEHIVASIGRHVITEIAGLDRDPIVRYHAFGNSFVKLTVWLVAKDFQSQYLVVHEFTKRVQTKFQQEGIVIRL